MPGAYAFELGPAIEYELCWAVDPIHEGVGTGGSAMRVCVVEVAVPDAQGRWSAVAREHITVSWTSAPLTSAHLFAPASARRDTLPAPLAEGLERLVDADEEPVPFWERGCAVPWELELLGRANRVWELARHHREADVLTIMAHRLPDRDDRT
ncbi:hypothetical protein [Streptomyces caniscabiei]|uniref:hypothetical protein n=1 Tax=Streptomyces caniscabiei TaxID=2746961 RepID=UPI0015C4F70B|nr:hypothetical protein [Streptomyces caniscabiei]